MSLFQDDFYSTKVSRSGRGGGGMRPGGWNRGSSDGRRIVLLVAVALLAGALIMLMLSPLFRSSGGPALRAGAGVGGSDQVVAAVDKVSSAVVSVISVFKDDKTAKPKGMGIGSGVMFQRSGDKVRLVTNNHVVEGGASFEVVLSEGEHRKATIVGTDWRTDLAVLEIDAAGIKSIAEFGDSDQLKRGETAIAIGSPLGFSQTITVGVVSSPKQTITVPAGPDGLESEIDVIQTDAAINQGNSGGALVDLSGRVVGINSLKIAEMGVEGLGFAIPINQARPIIESLLKDHKVKRPYIGITPADLQSFKTGTEVLKLPESVKTGVIVLEAVGPAKDAGLKNQDVIVELDGKPTATSAGLRKYLYYDKKIGDKLNVTYYRAGKKANVTMTLGELPDK